MVFEGLGVHTARGSPALAEGSVGDDDPELDGLPPLDAR
jgi:hypothetical protein